jgi:predicted ribosome quality control (RQC) complex YloA/Tae2 family protein
MSIHGAEQHFMDLQTLSSVIDELSNLLTGARVERVYEGAGRTLYVQLRRERNHYTLLLSPDRSLPRLHLVTKKTAAVASPNGFSLYLRSHAAGARITKVSLLNRDRVAEIRFSREGEAYCLLFELTGPGANILITDEALKILAVYYPIPFGDSVKRPMTPGIQYVPLEKRSPSTQFKISSVDRQSDQEPGLKVGPLGANREAEVFFDQLVHKRDLDSFRTRLRALVKKTLSKTERRVEALSVDLEGAGQAEEYRRAGDLILANLHFLERGREQAELKGQDGEPIFLRLDPKRSPAGNAELYFKKYKKAKKGREIIAARLKQAGEEASRLRSFLSGLEDADTSDALMLIQSDLVANGYLPGEAKRKSKQRSSPAAPFRKIEYQGWDILVGRSAAGNDYLTTKIAGPRDLWLHAEGLPGSHVLIKNPEARDIPPEVFSKAASLAAFHSKGKTAGKVAVTFTLAGQVKKPKGAKPGLVTLKERKTIMAVPREG